jgi:hypothetical protein
MGNLLVGIWRDVLGMLRKSHGILNLTRRMDKHCRLSTALPYFSERVANTSGFMILRDGGSIAEQLAEIGSNLWFADWLAGLRRR